MRAVQIDMFRELEVKKHSDGLFCRTVADYHKWLDLPDWVMLYDGTPERDGLLSEIASCKNNYDVYGSKVHACNGLVDLKSTNVQSGNGNGPYIWINEVQSCVGNEYWVLTPKGHVGGEHIDVCPYCGANLKQGCGNVLLIKASYKRWCNFLHSDPVREICGGKSDWDEKMLRSMWCVEDRENKDWKNCRAQTNCPIGRRIETIAGPKVTPTETCRNCANCETNDIRGYWNYLCPFESWGTYNDIQRRCREAGDVCDCGKFEPIKKEVVCEGIGRK